MPSPYAERIIADHKHNPHPILTLPRDLSDANLADLTTAADAFSAVEQLYVDGSYDADWTLGRFLGLALRLPRLSRLNLSVSSKLSDLGLRAIAQRLSKLTTLNLSNTQVTDAGVT